MEPLQILAAIILGLALIGYITCLVQYYWVTLILTAGVVAYLAKAIPINAQTIAYWGAAALTIAIALSVALSIKARNRTHLPAKVAKTSAPPGRRIVIDGTNVMYWDGETAQLDTLRSVVDYLKQRDISPIVFLDASSRHHLKDKSLTERGFARALGLPQTQVMVCPAGTEADVFILKFAKKEELPILSNDRFGDRSNLVKGIKIVKGVFTAGRPILDGL
ncbi:MAG: NYN domain-containing protein [Sulfitobacter sp.]